MKNQTLVVLALLWVSGSASATLIGYNFSGEFDEFSGGCKTEDYCGPYTGMLAIDNAQSGTPSLNVYLYDIQNIMLTLADGTELTATNLTFTANTTALSNHEVKIDFKDGFFDMDLDWVFGPTAVDISNIASVLSALTDATPLFTSANLTHLTFTECDPVVFGCAGTLSGLTEKITTVPEPITLALISLGLAGIGFTRRKMKT